MKSEHDKRSTLKFVRGGQLFFYNLKMLAQVSARIGKWAIGLYALIVVLLMTLFLWSELRILIMQAVCWVLHNTFLGDTTVWTNTAHQSFTANNWLNYAPVQQRVDESIMDLKKYGLLSLVLGFFVYLFAVVAWTKFFIRKGDKYTGDKFISGTRITTSKKALIKAVKTEARQVSDICLFDDVPLPYRAERQGIMVHGAPGTGKSQTLMELLDEIRARNEPVILYDKECTFKPYYFREELDHELNPKSADCENWDLWSEADNPLELADIFTFLIQKSVQGTDPFWVDSARSIATDAAWQLKDEPSRSPILLLQHLLTSTLAELRGLLKGTASENLVHEEIAKTAISIKSVLATYTKSLRFLAGIEKSGKPKFSIKNWIRSLDNLPPHKQSWLFITSRGQYHHELKPLLTLWLGLALKGVQSREADHPKRLWIVIDEMASLQHLERLSDTIADVRKFGGCVAIGLQSIAQLDFLYGLHESMVIQDLLNSSIYSRSPRDKVAERVSKELGKQAVDEARESQSYGPNAIRDGNTISHQRVTRLTVEPTDIMTLPDLTFYVRLRGVSTIGRLTREYKARQKIARGFVEREIDFDALGKINQVARQLELAPERATDVKKQQAFNNIANAVGDSASALDGLGQHASTDNTTTSMDDFRTLLPADIEQREAPLSVPGEHER